MRDAAVTSKSGLAAGWQVTLWTMVGVQFVMSISFSITSPIMPLFLPQLGVHSTQAIDLWAGVIASVTSFIGIFTAPIWGSLADRYGRKLMVLRSTFGIAIFTALMARWRPVPGTCCGSAPAWARWPASTPPPPCWSPRQVPESRWAGRSAGSARGNLVGIADRPGAGRRVADLTGSYRIAVPVRRDRLDVGFLGTLWFVPERFTPPTEARQSASMLPGWRADPIVRAAAADRGDADGAVRHPGGAAGGDAVCAGHGGAAAGPRHAGRRGVLRHRPGGRRWRCRSSAARAT